MPRSLRVLGFVIWTGSLGERRGEASEGIVVAAKTSRAVE